ncbi:hypothetical protein QRX60_06965 [Amycolatopsis mongoliensis]|uniref:DUF2269 domain-containing protein n=1 Tax=Amycolatopsis mongoliensis TaxID=715475 RepID=A0A9Y2JV92_9PSEU|nr:hypothetical protein [Amycolatopsis sp. 4-36]WIY03589.1 hypothetical protein QRX60_06965 [Amycolatopsis sp. 4-36]
MTRTKTSPRWRQTVVWLHAVSSVAWMSQALALVVLMSPALAHPGQAAAPTSMADRLDSVLLAPMANVSAFTGLLLAGATAWGYFRHWWVLTKFALTLIQLYAGIFLLSPALRESADTSTVTWPQIAGASLMASALSFQAWLSIAKPGKRTPWSPAAKPPTAPTWVFVAGVAAPAVDVPAGILAGYPLPALSLVTLIVLGLERRRRRRRAQPPTGRSPRSAPAASPPAT